MIINVLDISTTLVICNKTGLDKLTTHTQTPDREQHYALTRNKGEEACIFENDVNTNRLNT